MATTSGASEFVLRQQRVAAEQRAARGGRFIPNALVPTQASYSNEGRNSPPKASAAKKAVGATTFVGLAEALNNFQQKELVAKGVFEIADIYEIEFVTPELLDSTLAKQGGTVYSKVPMQQAVTAKAALDSNTNRMDTKGRTVSVTAGMQIVQFIETQIRGSSYITSQATVIVDKDGNFEPSKDDGQTAWYKINVVSRPLDYDKKRNDFAYHMKFIISPYAISSVKSEYFPKNRYRGSHKSYNYWFTGKNAEILSFEQEYNSLWSQVISSSSVPLRSQELTSGDAIAKRVYMAASGESDQGAANSRNEPGANMADLLYNIADQGEVKLQIVGDPAWFQQGEIATGISADTFNFSPFLPDGGINYDASEIVFDISWNRPTDYDYDTGLMPVTKGDGNRTTVYKATTIKHSFIKGHFKQELTGVLLIDDFKSSKSVTAAASDLADAGAGRGSANDPRRTDTGDTLSRLGIPPSTAGAGRGSSNDSGRLDYQAAETPPGSRSSDAASVLDYTSGKSLQNATRRDPTSDGSIVPPSLTQIQNSPEYISLRRNGVGAQLAFDKARTQIMAKDQ